jgi:hypothetical protein
LAVTVVWAARARLEVLAALAAPAARGGAGGNCGAPAPVNGLNFCGGSVSATSGMNLSCIESYCDGQNNVYKAECSMSAAGTSCSCRYNNQELCICKTSSQSCNNCCPGFWQGIGGGTGGFGGAGGSSANGGAGGIMTSQVAVVAVSATSGGN